MVERGGDGLVMNKCANYLCLTRDNDGLSAMCYLIVCMQCPCIK